MPLNCIIIIPPKLPYKQDLTILKIKPISLDITITNYGN